MSTTRFPTRQSAIYHAAVHIIANGPRTATRLFTEVDFGASWTRMSKLRAAIENGWLVETDAGIDVTDATRAHFAAPAPKEPYIGQITPARYHADWRTGSLSKKHIPNRRGPRADVPDWSVKADGYSIKTAGGCNE
jgi:hypothetical protein